MKAVVHDNVGEYKQLISKVFDFPRSAWNVPMLTEEKDVTLLSYAVEF